MSRSNHIDFLCGETKRSSIYSREIVEDGYCDFHRTRGAHHKCIGPNQWISRRGIITRKARFRDHLYDSCPKWYRQNLWSKVRSKFKQDLIRFGGEDFGAHDKWMSGVIGWYW